MIFFNMMIKKTAVWEYSQEWDLEEPITFDNIQSCFTLLFFW